MPTYRNTGEDPIDIPLLDIHVGAGETFEIPDELAAQFDANPLFSSSRAKTPDVTPDPVIVGAVTGPVPVIGSDPDPAPTAA